MKRLRKIAIILLSVLLILSLILVSVGTWFIRRPWTPLDGTLTVAGLKAPVRVIRDTQGIPQIYAENEADLVFAQGYVHAQDRLWQMEVNRRSGKGTLSAVFGDSTLWFDRFIRTLGLHRAAERELADLDGEARAVLDAYAQGVNAFIDAHKDSLPIEFTIFGLTPAPWEPIDTLVYGKVLAWSLSWNGELETLGAEIIKQVGVADTQQLMPPYADGDALNVPPEVNNYRDWVTTTSSLAPDPLLALHDRPHLAKGSNNWVIDGTLTASGKPLLANDTHLSLGMPSMWYENGLHGGRFNSIGFSFPGVPLVIIGHNTRIAWGVTDFPSDVQDYYIEKLDDPQNPTRYEYQGEWHDLQIIQEVIEVSGSTPVTEEIRLTRHGPLMNNIRSSLEGAAPMALQWTIFEQTRLFGAIYRLNLAGNWNEFRTALQGWDLPTQHFVYADIDGNIGYQTVGKLPIRQQEHQGLVPMPGWNDTYDWQGFVPFDQLYSVYNPPEHFFATANDLVVPTSYPFYLSYGFQRTDEYRITRIKALLDEQQGATVESMSQIQADNYSLPAEILRPYMLAVTTDDPLEAQALALLKDWNLRFDQDQAGAAIFQVWTTYLSQAMLADDLGSRLFNRYQAYGWLHMRTLSLAMPQPGNKLFDDRTTPQVERRDDMLRSSLTEAVNWLRDQYGAAPERWTWGRLHTITLAHQPLGQTGIGLIDSFFNSKPIASRSGPFTINSSWLATDGTYKMTGGVAQRMIIDLADLDQSRAMNSSGQNGQLWNPHRDDMIAPWEAVQYHPLLSSREEVDRAAHAQLILTPP